MIDSVGFVQDHVDSRGSRSSESILESWHFAIASQLNVVVLDFEVHGSLNSFTNCSLSVLSVLIS